MVHELFQNPNSVFALSLYCIAFYVVDNIGTSYTQWGRTNCTTDDTEQFIQVNVDK